MDFAWWVLFVCAAVTVFFAASIVRMPDLNSLSLQSRMDWPLPPQESRLRATCLEIADTFRWTIGDRTFKLVGLTAIGVVFLISGLGVYAAIKLSDAGSAVQESWNFVQSKLGLGLLFPGAESQLLQGDAVLESIVAFALDLLLGSWLIYLVAFGWSWAISRLFPVRWVKWAKVRQTTGDHNRAWRNRRRFAILIDHRQRCTPRSGDKGYSDYGSRSWI